MNVIDRRSFLGASGAALTATALVAPSRSAPAAEPKEPAKGRITLSVPNFEGSRPLRVATVDRQGTVRVETLPRFVNARLRVTEGWFVMVAGPETSPGPLRVIRFQVDEVLSPTAVSGTVGPEAARRLAVGTECTLVRPEDATTAQLRALPDLITMGPKPADTRAEAVAAQRARSILNLKMIALALFNFESANNHLPPAVVYGPDGKPWHSWRVLLLPYLEHMDLYQEYDFSQPWNSPRNLKLYYRTPEVYRDPIYGDAQSHLTHYAALVGAWKERFAEVHTAFPPSKVTMKDAKQSPLEALQGEAPKLAQVTDGQHETIAVAPVSPDRKIPWTKPEDITVGPDFPGLGKPGGIAAPYPTGANLDGPHAAPVLMVDGTVLVLLDTIEPELLRAMATRDAREAGVMAEEVDFTRVPVLALPQRKGTLQPTLKIRIEGKTAHAWLER